MARQAPIDTRDPTGRPGRWLLAALLLLALAGLAGWLLARGGPVAEPSGPASATGPGGPAPSAAVSGTVPAARLGVQVLATSPHDPQAFTQGLVWDAGRLFESTGLEGRSSLREVAPSTGEVLRRTDLPADVFGEGLAMVGPRLLQITWKDQVAYDWRKDDFEKLGEFRYTGEGWGLCLDGERLVMSDGSGTLTFRDPDSFAAEGRLAVTLDGAPVHNLNELECVGDEVYANVWLTDQIYRIDKHSGAVTAVVDAAGLLTPAEEAAADVLNGIAYKPDTGTFLITGKLWPKVFEVRFVESTAAFPVLLVPRVARPTSLGVGG